MKFIELANTWVEFKLQSQKITFEGADFKYSGFQPKYLTSIPTFYYWGKSELVGQ